MTFDQELVNLARVGYSYAVEVMAGWGGGHVLYLRDLELETNFAFVQTTTEPASPLTLGDCDWDTEWECYYDRYDDFPRNGLERTQESANRHYVEFGKAEGRHCHC